MAELDREGIEQLLRPQAFAHASDDIALRETHISWVILAGEYAYKIKKPVCFDFLDFSTPALRLHFCEEELRLNRRFAPELYLAVVAVTRGPQGLQFQGEGDVVDHAVRMRRFDETQLLDNIAARGDLDLPLLRALARELARLQAQLPVCRPQPDSDAPGTPAALLAAIEQNFAEIRHFTLAREERLKLEAVEQWSRQRYGELLTVMQDRVRKGRVLDGHGDAHLGNIARVDGAVRLFDCIDFNPDFRILDSVGEIAFLSMDMDARGYHGAAHRLLSDYLEYRDDFQGLALLDFYRCYFAMVRAKVSLLRQPAVTRDGACPDARQEFHRYLQMAGLYSRAGKPFFAITHGVSGSGKSTVAGALVEASGALRIRSDVERKRLFGLAPEQRSRAQDVAALYSTRMSRDTFDRLETLAELVVGAGFGVIVDATFLHRRVRERFRSLAHRLHTPFAIIDCVAEPDVLRRRLIAREQQGRNASEAGVAVMEAQLRDLEPLAREELAYRVPASSDEEPDTLWRRLRQHCPG